MSRPSGNPLPYLTGNHAKYVWGCPLTSSTCHINVTCTHNLPWQGILGSYWATWCLSMCSQYIAPSHLHKCMIRIVKQQKVVTYTSPVEVFAVSQPLHNCITPALYLPDQSWSASATPDSLFSFPNSPMSQKGGELSVATGLSPAEDSGRKMHISRSSRSTTSAAAGV